MAEDQDIRIKCVDCGNEFVFTAGEQAFYRERGLTHAPTRCRECREKRKSGKSGGGARSGAGSAAGGHGMHRTV